MLLNPVASDLPESGLIVARACAQPWRRFGPTDRAALARHLDALTPDERPRAVIVAPRDGAALHRVAERPGFVSAAGDARGLVRDLAADAAYPSRDAD